MNNGPEQRDEEIRAAIDELNEAQENVRRVREEGERWQQENPPPNQPESVRRMAEIDRFEHSNNAWNKQYGERRERLEEVTCVDPGEHTSPQRREDDRQRHPNESGVRENIGQAELFRPSV